MSASEGWWSASRRERRPARLVAEGGMVGGRAVLARGVGAYVCVLRVGLVQDALAAGCADGGGGGGGRRRQASSGRWCRGYGSLFRPAQTRVGCAARRVRSTVPVRMCGRVGAWAASRRNVRGGVGARGQWEAGCRAGRSGAVRWEEAARVCCPAGWVVCFPLVRDGTAGSRLEGCWAAHTQREACESWRSDEGNTSRAVPRIAKACRKGNRGSMASTASRAHRGISPHVIPARLRTVYVYRLRR